MSHKTFLLAVALLSGTVLFAQDRSQWAHFVDYTPEQATKILSQRTLNHRFPNNVAEDAVPEYTLPDVLTTLSGEKITTRKQWENVRRKEILEIFSREMYGHVPPRPEGEHFRIDRVETGSHGGIGTLKFITIFLDEAEQHSLHMLLAVPTAHKTRVPVFAGVNFYGIDSTLTGTKTYTWPYRQVMEAGFGIATIWRDEIRPDVANPPQHGVQDFIEGDWAAISAWAWGLSRVMDYLETDPDVDAQRVAAIGHSRLGKTALWAGANDERFALVVSNASGCCGAALSRRAYGENFDAIRRFPHWFVRNFWKWDDSNFPVDQHCLAALIAPRPLYIASCNLDLWCDPKGEWETAVACQPAYDLYKQPGLSHPDRMPEVGERDDDGTVAYKIRFGAHAILPGDWAAYLAFARRHFKMD